MKKFKFVARDAYTRSAYENTSIKETIEAKKALNCWYEVTDEDFRIIKSQLHKISEDFRTKGLIDSTEIVTIMHDVTVDIDEVISFAKNHEEIAQRTAEEWRKKQKEELKAREEKEAARIAREKAQREKRKKEKELKLLEELKAKHEK